MKERDGKPDLKAAFRPWPWYDSNAKLTRTDFSSGIASFSQTSFESQPVRTFDIDPENGKVRLKWERLWELESSGSASLSFELLSEAGFFAGGEMSIGRMRSEITEKVTESVSEAISGQYQELVGDGGVCGQGEVYLVAVWAQLFAEPFDLIWLAAMALHAYSVERNDFAFGYLSAIIHQKMDKEGHYLRGKKTLRSASEGGQASSRMSRPRTAELVAAMQGYVDRGSTAANAARLAFNKDKLGTSISANRKAFARHRSK